MATSNTVHGVPYANLINSSARRNGLDPWLLAALLWVESSFHAHARSSTGDYGIAQINLASHPNVTQAEADNPAFAIPWAARYLATLKREAGGSAAGALRAYNTGSSASSPAGNSYATKVLHERARLRSGGQQLPGLPAHPTKQQLQAWLAKQAAGSDPFGNPLPGVGSALSSAAGDVTSAVTGGWLGGLEKWVGTHAGYAFTYVGLLLFAVVLGIFGLLKLLGVQPSGVMRNGAKAAAVAA